MDDRIVCTTTDSIEVLNLSVRVHNALKRGKYWDVGEVIELSDDQLFGVRNLGEKGVAEIRDRLSRVELLDQPPSAHENEPQKEWSGEPQILIDLGPPTIPRHEVVRWQQVVLAKQIEARLLHPQLQVDDYTLAELVNLHSHATGLYETLLKIVTAPISVSQELESLLETMSQREIYILSRRFSFDRHSLESVASDLGITRERVRQIQQNAVARFSSSASAFALTRIRSALLFADHLDLSFHRWCQRLVTAGLVGEWSNQKFKDFDQLDLLVLLIRLSRENSLDVEIPDCLNCILNLRDSGLPNAPARVYGILNNFGGATERLVLRHLRYIGAVSLDWLADQDDVSLSRSELRLILECKEFFKLDENWYGAYRYVPDRLEKNSVLHNSLLKLFQYCGPLEIQDVYFGIEHTCSRTDFPIPPIDVLEEALSLYGYSTDDGLWYWGGKHDSELGRGEKVLWDTIYGQGGVAHHSQLMQAILDSGRTGPSLGGTLSRSPLFDNFQKGLYKLRGSRPDKVAIDRARAEAERIPVQLTVNRDTFGNIKIEANLGILVIANGTLLSESLPNLSGNWGCHWGDGNVTDVRVTQNEIRGLSKIIRFLRCEVGDRIALTFNVFKRTVVIRKIGDES